MVNLFKLGYLPRSATWMRGRYASVWADLNDDDALQKREKTKVPNLRKPAAVPVPAVQGRRGRDALHRAAIQCTWDPTTPYSW